MNSLHIYLNFNGNTEEVFNFYKSVFGGEFSALQRFKDAPESEKLSSAEREKIMHISLPIAKGITLMATDALESMGQKLTTGNNFYILIDTDSKVEADTLFEKLSAGGKTEMTPKDTFWGAYFGSFTDRFGIQWMVNYTYKK